VSLEVGLIGSGNIADAHLPAFRNHEQLELTAVCDANPDAAATIAEEFDVDTWDDFETFVDEAPIDAVDITLPHNLHHPAAAAAIDAGLHVHVEKPLAVSMAEGRDLVDRADDADVTLMVGQMQRFDPRFRAAKQAVEDGRTGQIRHARVDGIQNLRDYADPPHWLYDGEAAGGGGIISVLIHKLDLLRYLLGEPTRACALGRTVDPAFEDAEDYAVGLIEFENGAIVDLFSAYSAADPPYGESMWLFGDDGVITAIPEEGAYHADSVRMSRRVADQPTGFEPLDPSDTLPTDDPFVNELRHFADCAETGREPLTSGRDNLGTLATVFALYESIEADGAWTEVASILEETP
jgi:predicted dehydrogenase